MQDQSWILDSAPWIPDSNYWILHLYPVDLGFQIPDFYSCILDSKAQDSGFHKQKFPGFPHMGRFFYIFLVKVLQVRKQVVTPQSRSPRLRSCDQQQGCLFRWKRVTKALGTRFATPILAFIRGMTCSFRVTLLLWRHFNLFVLNCPYSAEKWHLISVDLYKGQVWLFQLKPQLKKKPFVR